MSMLEEALGLIRPLDEESMEAARKRLDLLTKPKDSLGRLEEFAWKLSGITGEVRPSAARKVIFTFAGDHGVADEGVSAFPKEVTRQMVLNFLSGGAGINVLARHAGAEVVVVDIGVDFEFGEAPGLVRRKVVSGTRNIRRGPAMTRRETLECIEAGIRLACEHAGKGVIYGTGEMGIANTTPASAMIAAFSGRPVEEVTGRGTGISDTAFMNKVTVIKEALSVNKPDAADAVDVLSKVGGAEIAGITGLVIGAAASRLPIVVDGFISTAGALAACEMQPGIRDYIFASHNSVERGHKVMLDRMGLKPMLDLELRLGEGTGAALAMTLIEAAIKVYNEMATFEDAGVSASSPGAGAQQ